MNTDKFSNYSLPKQRNELYVDRFFTLIRLWLPSNNATDTEKDRETKGFYVN
jgi:hypothetical protein